MKRTFIAIDIPENPLLTETFADFMNTLSHDKINWTNPSHLHLTLKFLGDTHESNISSISTSLEKIMKGIMPLSLKLSGAGVFQNLRNPRVIWLGIEKNEALQNLQERIEDQMTVFGYEKESKVFSPHLTMGRIKWIKKTEPLEHLLKKYQNIVFGEFPIQEVIFYESILTPKGSIYRALHTFPFAS